MTTRRSIALILSPVGLLLISAARLIIVANFNTTTAVTIASSGGVVNTLLGTIIPLVPVFIPYIALLLLLTRHFLLSIMTFVFAAFISPTSITAAEGLRVAQAYWNRTVAAFHSYQAIALVILAIIFIAVWIYNRSLVEGLSIIVVTVAALTLVIAMPNAYAPLPVRLASNNEHHLVVRASSGVFGYSGRDILVALGILAIVFVVYIVFTASSPGVILLNSFTWLFTSMVALIATIAFFPYLHFIYPVPQTRGYYAETAYSMWLNAERIELNTRLVYYGYVLSSDDQWFTVLLVNSRLIVYLPTSEVDGRSVCQPSLQAEPKPSPPLISWLYHSPSSLPPCGSEDEIALITAFVSSGQSLREISSMTHTEPERIIFLTNQHLHQKLSAALRAYECRRDWNAPTPVGQRFYYYPSIVPY
jgi:hypothetical protein